MRLDGQASMIQDRLDAAQRHAEAAEAGTAPVSYLERLRLEADPAVQAARQAAAIARLRSLPYGTLRRRDSRF